MNPAQINELDYIDFLIATQKAYSCTEIVYDIVWEGINLITLLWTDGDHHVSLDYWL